MGETIAFLISVGGISYFMWWFWTNDAGIADWDRKKRFTPHAQDDEGGGH